MELLIIATYCRILHQSKNCFLSSSSSQVQNSAKMPLQHHFSTIQHLQAAVLAFKPFLSPHACGPHATPCNLWKLIQGSLAPRQPPALFECPPHHAINCQSLQHIASYCSILHQNKNSFLSPKLPVQHHFSTIQDLQAAVLAFKPSPLSPHACGPHAASCNLWKLIQGSLTPRQPLDYLNAYLTMPWNCQSLQHIASYCSILHQSKNRFHGVALTGIDVTQWRLILFAEIRRVGKHDIRGCAGF